MLMNTLIATSVVRGSSQGESHGGVYLVDLENQKALLAVDWDTMDIDWQGRGLDRGLRGIAFDGERVFIAASDELFEFDKNLEEVRSYRCRYLKHCHEIFVYKRRLFMTSTGFDSILGFDLDNNRFRWGLNIARDVKGLRATPFKPEKKQGPSPSNAFHLNMVCCNQRAMFISGLHTRGVHAYTGRYLKSFAELPSGTHNAMPYRDGVLFNDTAKNVVRFVPMSGPQQVFNIPYYNPGMLTHTDFDDSRTARQAFGRGLCVIDEGLIAGGSSPSTVTLYDLDNVKTVLTINLSLDVRNAIHGLEVWPFDELPTGSRC
jgi:hypothetical protein